MISVAIFKVTNIKRKKIKDAGMWDESEMQDKNKRVAVKPVQRNEDDSIHQNQTIS